MLVSLLVFCVVAGNVRELWACGWWQWSLLVNGGGTGSTGSTWLSGECVVMIICAQPSWLRAISCVLNTTTTTSKSEPNNRHFVVCGSNCSMRLAFCGRTSKEQMISFVVCAWKQQNSLDSFLFLFLFLPLCFFFCLPFGGDIFASWLLLLLLLLVKSFVLFFAPTLAEETSGADKQQPAQVVQHQHTKSLNVCEWDRENSSSCKLWLFF